MATDTPRTDGEDRWQVDKDETGLTCRETVRIEWARELERECARLRAALHLAGSIAESRTPHLGHARFSGIAQGCIPCVVAIALGMSGDTATTEDFDSARRALEE